ncbi:flagellar assembly protein FliW [Heliobacterium undosum]|uniref:Flagellar assembly factor FliW n=1 Tax=Heliomicrobium undosum TaxID=121734 RepID=A0A845L382_9FIRM|nr:flagellar assembly protein FliW [Heliomicrobium undosum]MZP29475.1 flagellar assembly protein FliW [Heliomicrobium undosum]
MQVHSSRFGTVEFHPEDVIRFEKGLPGFEKEKRFILIPYEEKGPFFFLRSLDNPELEFFTGDPFAFFPDYEVKLASVDQQELAIDHPEEALALVIFTLADEPKDITVNLKAPLVINRGKGLARQVILDNDHYSTRHRLEAS